MSTKENVRNSQSAKSIFIERKSNDKNISKPTKRQREDPKNQVLVVTLGSRHRYLKKHYKYQFRCKEKIALKLNSLNDKKARYE